MPAYNTYPLVDTLVPQDIILAYQAQTNSLKTISFENLAASVIEQGPDVSFPFVNVADYGAVGDGVTDDTIAIFSALNAAGPNSVVVFPSGKTFLTTSQIQVPHNNQTLLGFGTVIISEIETQFQKFGFFQKVKGRITGLKFDCGYISGLFGLNAGCIDIADSSEITIDNCDFTGVAMAGVRIAGQCMCTVVTNNRFTRCFVGVFSDDDALAYQPMHNIITNNTIRDGLGTTGTAFSGGIKISGMGSPTMGAGHVINNNTLENVGQIGIELHTQVNDCTVSGNVVNGCGFGISIANCQRVSVSCNSLYEFTTYGLEAADGASYINFTNNVVQTTQTGADGLIVPDGSTDVNATGNNFIGCDVAVQLEYCDRVTITGCSMANPTGAAINSKGSDNVTIVGNTMDCNGAFSCIFLDSNDDAITNVLIASNILKGTVTSGIHLFAPAGFAISDVHAIGNNTSQLTAAGGAWNTSGSTTPIVNILRIRSQGNIGDGTSNLTKNLNRTVVGTSSNTTFFYEYMALEGAIIPVDATAGVRSFELPNAVNMAGYTITISKSDASGNAVTVTGYLGQTINGGASVSLASQYKRVTVVSDGANWLVTQSN